MTMVKCRKLNRKCNERSGWYSQPIHSAAAEAAAIQRVRGVTLGNDDGEMKTE